MGGDAAAVASVGMWDVEFGWGTSECFVFGFVQLYYLQLL